MSLSILALSLALTAPAQAAALDVGQVLPALTLPNPAGTAVPDSTWDGQVLVVNFWASWCRPCLAELPLLEELDQRLRGSGGRVVAVNIDRKQAPAVGVLKRLDLTMPVLMDTDNALVASCQPDSLPVTWLVGADGVVVKRLDGALGAADVVALEAEVRALIAGVEDGAAQR